MIIQFEGTSGRLLEEHQVTPDRYIAWATAQFRMRAFRAGVIISAIVFILLFIVALSTRTADEHPGMFWYIIAVDILLTSIFLSVAVGMKNGTGPVHTSKNNPTDGYRSLDLLRYTSVEFMSKITEREWLKIASFDLDSFNRKEAESNRKASYSEELIERLGKLRRQMKKVSLLSLLCIMLLTAVVLIIPQLTFQLHSPARIPLLIFCTILYVALVTALHGMVFLYGLIGFYTRGIKVPGEYYNDDMLYRGKGAIVWSLAIMFITALIYIGFMMIPFAIIYITSQ